MTNIQSAGSGNWNTGSSWAGGNVPAAADTVEILNGHTITLNGEINAIGALTVRNGGNLTVAFQMTTSAFANIIVDSGGKIYASRSVSSLLRVNGRILSNSSYGIDYGKSDDQISNAAVAAFIEIVTASDAESYSMKGILGGANNFITMYGAALMASSTLAGTEASSPENNDLVLTDDMALRPGSLADVTNGLADMIVLGQNPTLSKGLGTQGYQLDIYLVAGYNSGTKTVTLGDAGAGQTYWQRGGTSGAEYDNVDVARAANTPVYRISSNVGVRGTAYNLRPGRLIQGVIYTATFVNCSIWWGYYGLHAGNFTYDDVVIVGCAYGIANATSSTISGKLICAACNSGMYSVQPITLTGTLITIGCAYGLNGCSLVSSGTISMYGCMYGLMNVIADISGILNLIGNYRGIYNGYIICTAIATLYSNNIGIELGQHVFSGTTTISNSSYGCSTATCIFRGTTFQDNAKDILDPFNCVCYNVAFGSVDIDYTLANLKRYSYTKSVDHDGVTGAFKALTKGGIIEKNTETKPTGKDWSLNLKPVSTVDPAYIEKQLTLAPGETLTLNIWIKKDAAMAYLPWVAIIDSQNDTLYNPDAAALDIFTMANNTYWQTDTLTYTNNTSYDKEIIVRVVAMNGSGNVYYYWERSISSGGSGGGASVVGSSIVKAVI
jgi:hypothetical protein